MLNIVLFGPPGSGKGTQAVSLSSGFNLLHVSTGDLLRKERKEETPLGLEAESFIKQGLLVPDEVVIGMLSSHLEENSEEFDGVIFDGFPRTVAQAEALDKLLEFKGSSISACIALDVEEEELVSRLLERGKTSGRADDADTDVIRNRIKVYHEETAPVADFYKEQEKFRSIPGIGLVEDIGFALANEVRAINGE